MVKFGKSPRQYFFQGGLSLPSTFYSFVRDFCRYWFSDDLASRSFFLNFGSERPNAAYERSPVYNVHCPQLHTLLTIPTCWRQVNNGGLSSDQLVPQKRGLFLNFAIGLLHNAGLSSSNPSIDGSSQESQARDNREDHLNGVVFFAVGTLVSAINFWRLHCGDSPFYFFPILAGRFFSIAHGVYLFTAHISQRGEFLSQHCDKGFEWAWKAGHINQLFREIVES